MAAKKASAEKAADTVVAEEVEVTESESESESESEGGDAAAALPAKVAAGRVLAKYSY